MGEGSHSDFVPGIMSGFCMYTISDSSDQVGVLLFFLFASFDYK